jgi:hypothetical protein
MAAQHETPSPIEREGPLITIVQPLPLVGSLIGSTEIMPRIIDDCSRYNFDLPADAFAYVSWGGRDQRVAKGRFPVPFGIAGYYPEASTEELGNLLKKEADNLMRFIGDISTRKPGSRFRTRVMQVVDGECHSDVMAWLDVWFASQLARHRAHLHQVDPNDGYRTTTYENIRSMGGKPIDYSFDKNNPSSLTAEIRIPGPRVYNTDVTPIDSRATAILRLVYTQLASAPMRVVGSNLGMKHYY